MLSPKRILIATAAFLALLLAIGFLLPGIWHAERTVVIRAPASTVFPYLNNIKRWREWSVWNQQQTEYSGPEAGVGATGRWNSEEGRIVMKIMQSEPDQRVAYTLLSNGGAFRAEGILTLLPEGEATRVVWSAVGEPGRNPANRYFAILQGYRIGGELADSLELLKQRLETKP